MTEVEDEVSLFVHTKVVLTRPNLKRYGFKNQASAKSLLTEGGGGFYESRGMKIVRTRIRVGNDIFSLSVLDLFIYLS